MRCLFVDPIILTDDPFCTFYVFYAMPMPQLSSAEVDYRANRVGVSVVGRYAGALVDIKLKCHTCCHRWVATAASVLRGHGCPSCARKKQRLTEDEVRSRLAPRNITLMGKYKTSMDSLRVRCMTCNHVWRTLASSVMLRSGCPACAGCARITPREAARRCKKVGLMLLGGYSTSQKRVRVRCRKCSREWEPRANDIFNGHGCRCKEGYGNAEEKVRKIVERVTGWRFPKAKPIWLRGRSRTNQMDLDGYNERHSVAFEYQGIQHYRALAYFGGATKLLRTKRNDERKRQLCRRHGVLLIRIPYWKSDVASFVSAKLRAHEVEK